MQDNQSLSTQTGTIRGLHCQIAPNVQGKLVRVIKGAIWDVAVDIRRGSPTYRAICGGEFRRENWRAALDPAGFLHGFCTLEPDTEVIYKVTAPYDREAERAVIWNDPTLALPWPVDAGQSIAIRQGQGVANVVRLRRLVQLQMILITGATGQVGRALVEEATSRGLEFIAVSRPEFDFENLETVDACFARAKPDLVINAAAYTAVDAAETHQEAAKAGNHTGPERLAQLCAAADIPLIHISTDYVFDGTKGEPYVETDPTNPTGVYGADKARR